jgi:raffinose/stachyose/melibiose transport system permease protein
MATTINSALATDEARQVTPASGRSRSGRVQRRGVGRWIVLSLLTVAVIVTLFPFLLAALNAVKSPADYAENGPLALPHSIDLTGLATFYQEVNFTQKLINSIVISAAVAVLAVALSLLNAYALGIGRVRGRRVILVLFLMAMTVPQESLVYPLYYLSKSVGLFDTKMSVIVIFTILQCAFGTYLLSATLTAFPGEILEAARIDGAGPWKILWTIVLPVVRPTLTVLATFFFIWTWN